MKKILLIAVAVICAATSSVNAQQSWQSKYAKVAADGSITYLSDDKGNTIPDFSRVGYWHGDRSIPEYRVTNVVETKGKTLNGEIIQKEIDRVAALTPDKNGHRGTVLIPKGTYVIDGALKISVGGIVLRGEGMGVERTVLIAAGTDRRALIQVSGSGSRSEVPGSRVAVTDEFVPEGAFSFNVSDGSKFKAGDRVILYKPSTDLWITDLRMDRIVERPGTKQWTADGYKFYFDRTIVDVQGNKVTLDNPVVMQMDQKYGAPELYKYTFDGRIAEVGVENLILKSNYASDTDEEHSWIGVNFDKVENSWARDITTYFFANTAVNLNDEAKNITVMDCECFDAKSIITGGRRYSFNCNGQQCLVMNCRSTDGRHDYVTGARVFGPNVFYNCTAERTHADIGPHHRWSSGTLYDNITTDGDINIQDRGNFGSGHGWTGTTQVVWNSKARKTSVQNPWVSANNYCIGLIGEKSKGRFADRNDGIWEGNNQPNLEVKSLYEAQLKSRLNKK